MDNDVTKIIPTSGEQNTPSNGATATMGEKNQNNAKKGNNTGAFAAAAGVVGGASIGVAGTYAATHSEPESEIDAHINAEAESPNPEDVIFVDDEGIRFAHVEADNFKDAFAEARAQVGAGGMFEYEGKLYSTYTKDEWQSLSSEQRNEYQDKIMESAPDNFSSHDTNSSEVSTAHAQSSYTHSGSMSAMHNNSVPAGERIDVVEVNHADNEIHVLGVDQVQDDSGHIMNVALVENQGDVALMVDVNNDGKIEVIVHDDNVNGIIEANEIHDIHEAGIRIEDINLVHEQQTGETSSFAYEDDMPDYYNDADFHQV